MTFQFIIYCDNVSGVFITRCFVISLRGDLSKTLDNIVHLTIYCDNPTIYCDNISGDISCDIIES